MIPSPAHTRRLLGRGVVGLLGVTAAGAAMLSAVENVGYLEGLSLAFSTVSTTGFGPGPQTGAGLAVTMAIFAAGAVCWFSIIVAAFEIGMRRSGTSLGPYGYIHDDPVWSRVASARRRGGDG